MNKSQENIFSKTLSFALRHKPEELNIILDDNGWTNIDKLLIQLKEHFKNSIELPQELITKENLLLVVSNNDKKRFAVSEDGLSIRASQGHSTKQVSETLGYQTMQPPKILYHGTATKFLHSIKQQGLISKSRHHVHLSTNIETAIKVGERHGKVVVLSINTEKMFKDGYQFYLSDNNVWLTNHIPVEYILFNE